LEILVTYMHEIAHLFITFLALDYAKNLDAITPDDCTVPGKGKPEAGALLESTMFGGIYLSVREVQPIGVEGLSWVSGCGRAITIWVITRLQ
jgi:hypothetical protein